MPGQGRSFLVFNGPSAALTAHFAYVTTGTAIKTMLQIKPTTNITGIWWGYQFDSIPNAPVYTELISTGTVGATVTSYAAGDIVKYGDSGGAASVIAITANTSGYTSSGEGTITATRLLDSGGPPMASGYETMLPLDREFGVVANDFLRIRMHTATAVLACCWLGWVE